MAWIIYSFCTIALLGLIGYLLRNLLPLWLTAIVGLLLLAFLLTPVAVPGTEELAPAALASVYESLFGREDLAGQLFRPVLWTGGLSLLLVIGGFLLKRRLAGRTARSAGEQEGRAGQ